MRAILCTEFGGPERLSLQDLPMPEPGPGEIRVRVEAAGVNFPDTLIIENRYQLKPALPFSPGGEIAGVVEALGEGVSGFAVGDAVLGMLGYGGYREAVIARPGQLVPRPATMDAATAAAFPTTYGTSMHALRQRADLQPGETLLVLGAAGGVGLAAVEIGKAMGARVIAAASTAAKLDIARAAGADECIDYATENLKERTKELTGGRGADVVYDPVGGDLFEAALRATAWEGRVLVVGFASGTIPRPPMNLTLLKGCAILGVFWGEFRRRDLEADLANFRQLFAWHAEGRLKPLIGTRLPLEQAADALRLIAGRGATGKIVLTTGAAG